MIGELLSTIAGIQIIILCHLCGKLLISETQHPKWRIKKQEDEK